MLETCRLRRVEPFTTVRAGVDGGRLLENQRIRLESDDRAGFANVDGGGARGRTRVRIANYLEANGGLQVAAEMAKGELRGECAAVKLV